MNIENLETSSEIKVYKLEINWQPSDKPNPAFQRLMERLLLTGNKEAKQQKEEI